MCSLFAIHFSCLLHVTKSINFIFISIKSLKEKKQFFHCVFKGEARGKGVASRLYKTSSFDFVLYSSREKNKEWKMLSKSLNDNFEQKKSYSHK